MKTFLFCMAVFAVFTACKGSAPSAVSAAPAANAPEIKPADELDAAIRETSDYLNKQLPARNKLVILNIQSDFPALSEYIIDELIANTVNDRVFSVVDRQQLNTIRAELDFQMSGEVDDDTAQALGRLAGAQIIVSGAVSRIGDLYRLRVRALNVQSAQIEGQFNRNIPVGPIITALVGSQATGYGDGSNYGGSGAKVQPAAVSSNGTITTGTGSGTPAPQSVASSGGTVTTGTASTNTGSGTPARATPAASAPASAQTQLYVGTNQNDAMADLYSALDWITQNAQSGANYVILLGKNQAITPTELSYGNKTVGLILKSAGGAHTVSFEGNSPSYSLFTVKSGVTLMLEDGVTLRGTQNDAAKSLVEVDGGRFVMNGGALTGNKTRRSGGGVYVKSGTFTMNKGSIRENTASDCYGGGVYVESGTFTMNDGDISGNTASHSGNGSGGGVAVRSGTFYMAGGTISGNTASGDNEGTLSGGGGVYVRGTFTMTGGTISENTSRGQGGGVQSSKFTMSGGTISGNTTSGRYGGGGVYVYSDTFTMTGGIISGNTTTNGYGGGVYVLTLYQSSFIKSGTGNAVIYGSNAPDGQENRASSDSNGHAVYYGGLYPGNGGKKRNTTARAATAMDSTKDGPAGGWE